MASRDRTEIVHLYNALKTAVEQDPDAKVYGATVQALKVLLGRAKAQDEDLCGRITEALPTRYDVPVSVADAFSVAAVLMAITGD